jgi:hypothetical protein
MTQTRTFPLLHASDMDNASRQYFAGAFQPLHTTSYIDKGEASIIATREGVS